MARKDRRVLAKGERMKNSLEEKMEREDMVRGEGYIRQHTNYETSSSTNESAEMQGSTDLSDARKRAWRKKRV